MTFVLGIAFYSLLFASTDAVEHQPGNQVQGVQGTDTVVVPRLPTMVSASPKSARDMAKTAVEVKGNAKVSETLVNVTTRLTPEPSQIGDVLTVEVIAAYPDGYSVNLPTGTDFSPLALRGIKAMDAESSGSGWRRVFKIELQYFSVGEAKVPSFPLTYVDGSGNVEKVRVPSKSFTVNALLANEADPQALPNDPPVSLEYPNESAETVILSALATFVVGGLALLMWMRLRRREQDIVLPPPVPAHESAFEALDQLEEQRPKLIEDGRTQDYFVELTSITKAYLQDRFGFDVLDRTTDEIKKELSLSLDRLAPLSSEDVLRFLDECDLVKFARYAPDDETCEGALKWVRNIVEEVRENDLKPKTPEATAPSDSDSPDSSAKSPAQTSPGTSNGDQS